jgi:hypothetical protein
MPRLIRFTLVAVLIVQPSFGQESTVLGIWKLVSNEVEVQASGEKSPVMGEKPSGFVAFTPEGRVFFVLTADGRKAAKTDPERAELFKTRAMRESW